MKKTIEYLNKDRKVNKTFMEKLEKVGLEIRFGTYSYWTDQEYVQIGRKKVWLVCEGREGNSQYIQWRYQNNVIADIYETIRGEKVKAEDADNQVQEFFKRLELDN